MGPKSDREVINIMIQGGEQICDYALSKWIADEYKLGEESRRENIKHWKETRTRIRSLANEMKKQIKK